MVDISAPQPRLAPALFSARHNSKTQSRPSAVVDDTFYSLPRPRALNSPPPLLSPYRLPEDAGHHKLSKPLCSPTKRRRGLARNLSRTARHRHCARSDCCINTFPRPLTSLDDLPWISSLAIEPDHTNPWDIADLSLLNVPVEEERSSGGTGPVRRRKTSLRLDSLAQRSTNDDEPAVAFPFIHHLSLADPDRVLQTPPPRDRFIPSEVVFQRLRPIFPSDIEVPSTPINIDASRRC